MGGGGGVLQCSWEKWEGDGSGEGETGEGRGHTQSSLCVGRCDKGPRALSEGMGDVGREVWAGTEKPWTLSLEEERSEFPPFLTLPLPLPALSLHFFVPLPSPSFYLCCFFSRLTVQRMHPRF